jgi:hypothetical protein
LRSDRTLVAAIGDGTKIKDRAAKFDALRRLEAWVKLIDELVSRGHADGLKGSFESVLFSSRDERQREHKRRVCFGGDFSASYKDDV